MLKANKIVFCLLAIFVSLSTAIGTAVAASNDANQSATSTGEMEGFLQYPLMRPSVEEMRQWQDIHLSAAKAPLNMMLKSALAGSLGENFSLLSYLSYIPSERDQGQCGNCWVWAGTGVMEIDQAVKIGKSERLSIQYFNSNFNNGTGSKWACCGGWLEWLAEFYNASGMSIPWSNTNASYKDGVGGGCEIGSLMSAGSIEEYPRQLLGRVEAESIETYGVGKEMAIRNIKNVLQQKKAIWFAFYLPTDGDWRNNFVPFWSTKSELDIWQPDFACGKNWTDGAGHAVLLVGYNDTDPKNRYWLLLNSWGTTNGRQNGLFRMSMDMNYDCMYHSSEGDFYAFLWETLSIEYPPNTPSQPQGPKLGYVGKSNVYSTSTTADGGKIRYIFDWGDKETTTTEFVDSGVKVKASHYWLKPGLYSVKVKAEDCRGLLSDWSLPAVVKVGGTRLSGYATVA